MDASWSVELPLLFLHDSVILEMIRMATMQILTAELVVNRVEKDLRII